MKVGQFLRRVLPDTGPYFVLYIKGNRRKQLALSSIPELITAIQQGAVTNHNVFFSPASYISDENRKKDNVNLKKCFYIDIDTGPEKPYPTVKEALTALADAIKRSPWLPKPTFLIVSGHGLHAYWELREAIDRATWAKHANYIHLELQRLGVEVDAVVTRDATRVLRVPGTMNVKDPEQPVACQIFRDTGAVYDATAFMQKAPHLSLVSTGSELSAGLPDRQHPPSVAASIIPKCAVLKHVLDTGGADCDEPQWKDVLNLLAYTEDGESLIHKVSNGHPDYDSNKTEEKFKARLATKAQGAAGPTTCTSFENSFPMLCGTCAHKSKIKSPIRLGEVVHETLPLGLIQNERGIFAQGPEGELDLWLRFRFTDFQVVEDRSARETYAHFTLRTVGAGRYKEGMYVPMSVMNDKKTIYQAFVHQGFPLQNSETVKIGALFVAWVQQLRDSNKVRVAARHFGWVSDPKPGFAIGNKTYWHDGEETTSYQLDPKLRERFTPHGSGAPWHDAADIILKSKNMALVAPLAAAFGAPLMNLTGISGGILSLTSAKSGTGKTTSLNVAQAVWGHPRENMLSMDDTPNYITYVLGQLRTMPMFWDEVRAKGNTEKLVDFLFRVSQGQEKNRLTSQITTRSSGSWETIMVVASNESMLDHAVASSGGSTDAGARRVFELQVNAITFEKKITEVLPIFRSLNDNYGHAGALYAKWLAMNAGAASKLVTNCMHLVSKHITGQENRFYVAIIASMLAGATLAKKMGLLDFDVNSLAKYLLHEADKLVSGTNEFDTTFSSINQHNVMDLVSEYIQETSAHMLYTSKLPGKGRPGPDPNGNIEKLPERYPVYGQVATEESRVRLVRSHWLRWLHERGIPAAHVSAALANNHNRAIGKSVIGLHITGCPQVRVICLDLKVDGTGGETLPPNVRLDKKESKSGKPTPKDLGVPGTKRKRNRINEQGQE